MSGQGTKDWRERVQKFGRVGGRRKFGCGKGRAPGKLVGGEGDSPTFGGDPPILGGFLFGGELVGTATDGSDATGMGGKGMVGGVF